MSNQITTELPKTLPDTYYQDHPEAVGSFLEDMAPLDVKYQIFSDSVLRFTDLINVFCLNKHFNSLFFPDPKTEEGEAIINEQGYRRFICKLINNIGFVGSDKKILNAQVEVLSSFYPNLSNESITAFLTGMNRFARPLFESMRQKSFNILFQEPALKNSDLSELFRLCRSPMKPVLEKLALQQMQMSSETFSQGFTGLRTNPEYCQQVKDSCEKLQLTFNLLDPAHKFKKEQPDSGEDTTKYNSVISNWSQEVKNSRNGIEGLEDENWKKEELDKLILARIIAEKKSQIQEENRQKTNKNSREAALISNCTLVVIVCVVSAVIFQSLRNGYDF